MVGSALGTPKIAALNRPKLLQNRGCGASGLKVGVPQKRRSNDDGSNPPFSGLFQEIACRKVVSVK